MCLVSAGHSSELAALAAFVLALVLALVLVPGRARAKPGHLTHAAQSYCDRITVDNCNCVALPGTHPRAAKSRAPQVCVAYKDQFEQHSMCCQVPSVRDRPLHASNPRARGVLPSVIVYVHPAHHTAGGACHLRMTCEPHTVPAYHEVGRVPSALPSRWPCIGARVHLAVVRSRAAPRLLCPAAAHGACAHVCVHATDALFVSRGCTPGVLTNARAAHGSPRYSFWSGHACQWHACAQPRRTQGWVHGAVHVLDGARAHPSVTLQRDTVVPTHP